MRLGAGGSVETGLRSSRTCAGAASKGTGKADSAQFTLNMMQLRTNDMISTDFGTHASGMPTPSSLCPCSNFAPPHDTMIPKALNGFESWHLAPDSSSLNLKFQGSQGVFFLIALYSLFGASWV